MPVRPRARTHEMVFVDLAGRRIRVFRAVLLLVIGASAALIALLIAGLAAGSSAPRTFLGPADHPCAPGKGTGAAIPACARQFHPLSAPGSGRHR